MNRNNWKSLSLIGVFIAVSISNLCGQSSIAKTVETQTLKLNQPIEQTIKGGETQSFQFNVKTGYYARAEVEQKNIDVVVSLFAPDGNLVVDMDGAGGKLWREAVSVIAEKKGKYRVEIRAYGTADQSGNYTIKLVESRRAVAADQKRSEAESHLSSGRKFYEQAGNTNYEAAIKQYESAIKLWRALGETEWEAVTLTNLGGTYSDISKNEQAADSFDKAAKLFRTTKDRFGEAEAIHRLGIVSVNLSQYGKARDSFEQALLIFKELKAKKLEIDMMEHLGDIYFNLGNYEKSLDYCGKVLSIEREIGDRKGEADALAFFGDVYRELKQFEKMQIHYDEALSIIRKTNNRRSEAVFLNNIAVAYAAFNRYEKAQDYYEQSLIIYRELKDIGGEVFTLINAGGVYEELNQNEKAQKYFEQSLKLSKEIKSRFSEMRALKNLGDINSKLNQAKIAQSYYEQALIIAKETKNREEEGDVLNSLMLLQEKQKQIQLAIFYGKQAVNAIQTIRGEIKTFDKDTQRNFIKANEPTYRKLADLLISEGRLPEAQAVLDLLKEEEFKDVILRRSGETPDTVPYSKAEADVGKQVENLAKLERERAELLKQKEQAALPADKQSRLDQIPTEIEAANRAFRLALDALGKTESSSTDRVAEIQSEKSLQRTLAQLSKETNSGAVAIYTVLGTEEKDNKSKTKFGWVILVTPTSRKAYPIDVTDLEQTVFQFRDALSSDKYDPKPAAQKLYRKLFRQTSAKQKTTLEDDLETLLSNYKDKTLMWSLDGILRYVPMAALHDGAGYLVEKYRNVIFTKESFLTLMEKDAAKWQVLGLGVSERRENFNALPGAEKELRDIVREAETKTGIINGAIKLNKDFTEEATLKLWREGAFPVIHIASHYSFNSTDPTSSFLLVGDGHLSFSEMQDKDNLFGAVDLLTLSACDTGLSGNGKEAEGFAYLAQSLGAKSVIASLWKVSDAGTPELMIRFYKLRKENLDMPKGEAFRQAQISLLAAENVKKNSTATRSEIISLSGQKVELPPFIKDEKKPFAHPHYWASFVLIGNWR